MIFRMRWLFTSCDAKDAAGTLSEEQAGDAEVAVVSP